MIHKQIDKSNPKGWFVGPWNSKLQIPIGYANQGINEPHLDTQMHEIYLVAKGWSKIQVGEDIINTLFYSLPLLKAIKSYFRGAE